jgi:uncharacterized membrane protein
MSSNVLRHLYVVRMIRARPRLFVAAAAGIAVTGVLPHTLASNLITRLLIGWNTGAWLYIALAGLMMATSTAERTRHRARAQDEGRVVIITLVMVAAIASLAAIVVQLATVKEIRGALRYAHLALAASTILSSWAFTQVMFALHYAHDYFVALINKRPPGIDFPGGEPPDYTDFLYLSFVIGTSAQTADVSFTSRAMRRTALAHCVLSFVFNTTVLALTINMAAGLF